MNITNLALIISLTFSAWMLLRDDLASVPEGILLLSITCALVASNN
jgi:hypothetical protein